MKRNKGKQIDLLYTNNETEKKQKKSKQKKFKTDNNSKKEIINLNNEIIIGMTPKKEKNKKKDRKNKEKKKRIKKDVKKNNQTKKQSIKKNVKNKNNAKKQKIVKWTTLILLIITAIIIFMLSDVFNIKEIVVNNNEKITTEEIISLSELTNYENIFKINKKTVKEKIKQNAYISNVKIKRNLLGKITIVVEERKPKYMLEFINAYVYVDNQGYMLEVTNEPIEAPILIGIKTQNEAIKSGERLVVEDLKKLDDINQIMETAKNRNIDKLITKIDISDDSDYQLTISSENKLVHFADAENINAKILIMISIIEQEKGNKGEIFLENVEKGYFRESVNSL